MPSAPCRRREPTTLAKRWVKRVPQARANPPRTQGALPRRADGVRENDIGAGVVGSPETQLKGADDVGTRLGGDWLRCHFH